MEPFKPPFPPRKEERDRPFPLRASLLPAEAYSTSRIIRFSHCDPAGIVYTPRFIDLVNGVIEDFFNDELQINYYEMIGSQRIGLGYASVDTDFFKPALMGDKLVFTPLISRIGRSSAILVVHCYREVEEVMRCRLVMVTTSLNTNRAISMPEALKVALVEYQKNCNLGVRKAPPI